MRLYEFSKQSGIPSKELIEILAKGGFKVTSHMAVLTPEATSFLQKKFAKDRPKEPAVSKAKAPIQTESKKSVIQEKVTPLAPSVPKQPAVKPVPAQQAQTQSPKEIKTVAPLPPLKKEVIATSPSVTPVKPVEQTPGKPIAVESMYVADFASKTNKPVSEVILTLLRWGIVAAKNHVLTEDVVTRLAHHYQLEIIGKSKEKHTEEVRLVKPTKDSKTTHRLPVVVVIGHVDHGKTTLLDFIRKTRVASREKGGITQHLGAYEATTPQGNVVFIDTPGHEAFSKMRVRGIKVADIAILVVAADDGVMPQTVEAIKHAKAMGVPIIVAINKIDKAEPAQIEAVKRSLVQYELLPEEWGGEVVIVPLSAKTGKGVDQLLDMIILQSQMMELQADATGPAHGYVLEAQLEKGHGPVATVLCQHGILRIGDYFKCGITTGRVNALINSQGQRVAEVKPSIPVLVAGFTDLPHAGDAFAVIDKEAYKKYRSQPDERSSVAFRPLVSEGDLNILLKTDTHSSKEAILGSMGNLFKKFEKKPVIVHAAIGDVSESDVSLAAATGSTIFAFHVKTEPNALSLAQKNTVSIHSFDVIYKLLEALEAMAEGAKEIKMIKTKTGEALVRQVFAIKGIGTIAGCYVKDGRFTRDGSVVIWRNNRKVGEGRIKSLQRDKKAVKEVHTGYECAFLIDGFDQWELDDRVECFIEVPEQQK